METLFLGPFHTNADIFETAYYRRLHLSVDKRQKEHVFSNRVADLRGFVAKHYIWKPLKQTVAPNWSARFAHISFFSTFMHNFLSETAIKNFPREIILNV